MIRGTENITGWFESTKQPYWRLYPHRGVQSRNFIFESSQDEGKSHGDALEELKRYLKMLNRGTYTLIAFDTAGQLPKGGYQYTDIEIASDGQAVSSVQMGGIMTADEVDKKVREGIEKWKAEQELEAMKKRVGELEKVNKELEKTANEPLNRVMKQLEPFAPQIIQGIFKIPALPQVAGLHHSESPEENNIPQETEVLLTTEQEKIVSDFLAVLASHERNWPDLLQRLTTAIQQKPSLLIAVQSFI